jgi:hypothetical protein
MRGIRGALSQELNDRVIEFASSRAGSLPAIAYHPRQDDQHEEGDPSHQEPEL